MSDIAAARKRKRSKADDVAPNAAAGARKSARASVVSDAPTTTRNEVRCWAGVPGWGVGSWLGLLQLVRWVLTRRHRTLALCFRPKLTSP